jgi:hypothetical protein
MVHRQLTLRALGWFGWMGFALLFLLSPNLARAQSIPTTLGWFEIPNTRLRSVCPPPAQYPSIQGAEGCSAVVDDWNSAVFDTRRNRLIVWGGGHNGYYGNELYAVNLDNLTVQRITDPGLPAAPYSPCVEAIANGTQPNSRHTYDGMVYLQNLDRMFVNGGSLACGAGERSTGTWTFDFVTKTWQRMNPAGPIPEYWEGKVSGYDPNTGKVFLHSVAYLYSYDPMLNTYQRLGGSEWPPLDSHMVGVIDPKRRKFVIIGNGDAWIYDIGSGSTYTRQALSTTGGSAIVNSPMPGLAYDPTTDRIVAWNGGNTAYSLNLDTRVWTALTYSNGPGAANSNGTYKRWAYSQTSGVFVAVNSVDRNAYTFRLTISSSDLTPPAAPIGLRVE